MTKYNEYLIEYDPDNLMVYVSGLDGDNFWDELFIEEDVNDPESYALGYQDSLKAQGIFSTVQKVIYD